MERLQKFIAASGLCSRRKAEELIKNNKVKVNGDIINTLGTKVSDSDIIMVNDKLLTKEKKEYYLLNKPRGYVSTTSDEKDRKTIISLIDTKTRIYPVGRLDYDTTGVILLTNDGDFANIISHPSFGVEKVYRAKIEGLIKVDAINKLKTGVLVDGVEVSAKKVKLKKYDTEANTSMVLLTIGEGYNHQVKKMFEAVGFKVIKLKREAEGFFDLKNLNSGEYRKLTTKEVTKVYELKEK